MSYRFVDARQLSNGLNESMSGTECEDCYQVFTTDQDFKAHREYCIQSELPVLDSFERETEDGEGSNADSPPKLEPMEQDSEESSNEQEPITFSNLAYSFNDEGECPSGYKEVFSKCVRSLDGKLSAFYSIQRPVEWSDSEILDPSLLNSKKSIEHTIINKPIISNFAKLPRFSLGTIGGSLTTIDGPSLKASTKMKCPICDLVLFRHNYGAHYRIHSGSLPYQCYFCDKKFRTSSSRKIHHRLHTGDKPYVCGKCSYKTITKRNLDRHIFNQHVKQTNRRQSVKFKVL